MTNKKSISFFNEPTFQTRAKKNSSLESSFNKIKNTIKSLKSVNVIDSLYDETQ